MTITPFLTVGLRGKKDALTTRQKARRVAHLLGYSEHEQACIAAAVFVVANQALSRHGKAHVCFQIEGHTLHVYARTLTTPAEATGPNRISNLLPEPESRTLYRLAKPLPPQANIAECDLGWLVKKVEESATGGMFEEIVKQNQEILALLHELRLCRTNLPEKEEKPPGSHAA